MVTDLGVLLRKRIGYVEVQQAACVESVKTGGTTLNQFDTYLRTVNECFRTAVKIYDAPHVLTDLLGACRFFRDFLKPISQVVMDLNKRIERITELDSLNQFMDYRRYLIEEVSVIDMRITHLEELLEGKTAEPGVFMSHEEMLNFIDMLAPVPVEHGILGNPNPIDEPDGTTIEVPDDAAEAMSQPVTDPPGGFGEAGPYYDPASPLDQDQLSEAINPSRNRANADEPDIQEISDRTHREMEAESGD